MNFFLIDFFFYPFLMHFFFIFFFILIESSETHFEQVTSKFSYAPILLVTSLKCVSEDSMRMKKKIVDKFFQEKKIDQKRIKKIKFIISVKFKIVKLCFNRFQNSSSFMDQKPNLATLEGSPYVVNKDRT